MSLTQPLTLTLNQGDSDVDVWHLTLNYNPNLANLVNLHTQYQGRRSNMRVLTEKQTDGHYQVHYLPASQSYAVDNNLKIWTISISY